MKGTLMILALLGVFALAPAVALAQQEKAVQDQKPESENQPDVTPAKTEAPVVQTEKPAKTEEDSKLISVPGGKALGMSILGNQEAPKALVIVPWKSSELGNTMGISTMLDDSRLPIDKEVFMRMLSYYEIRSGRATAQPSPEANRRKQ